MKRSNALHYRWDLGLMCILGMSCALAQHPPSDFVLRSGDAQKFMRMYPGVSWQSNLVSWYYNPNGQPSAYDTASVVAALTSAANKWSAVCGVTFKYMGASTAAPATNDGMSVIGWKALA